MSVSALSQEAEVKIVWNFSPERWDTLRRIAGEHSEAARWREDQKARGLCPAIKIMADLAG